MSHGATIVDDAAGRADKGDRKIDFTDVDATGEPFR